MATLADTFVASHHNMVLAWLRDWSGAWLQLPVEKMVEGVEGFQGVCNVICVQLSTKGLQEPANLL